MRYGPSFQGLVEAWRQDRTIFGRIVLPPATTSAADAYGLHPALLDAAAQTMQLALAADPAWSRSVLMPVAWSDVTLYAPGATELRVCLELQWSHAAWGEATASLHATDADGQPVATVGALRARRATAEEIHGRAPGGSVSAGDAVGG